MSFNTAHRIIAAVLAALISVSAFAGSLRAAEQQGITEYAVDISERRFSGQNASFYFNMPEAWYDAAGLPMVSVKRRILPENDAVLDWFTIEYTGSQEWAIMRLLVYDKTQWRDNATPLIVVMKTQDYVFAVAPDIPDAEMPAADRPGYDAVLSVVMTAAQIKRCIGLASGQQEERSLAVIAGGAVLDAGVVIINDIYYLPLRSVCEAFGYDIGWDQSTNSVTIDLEGERVDSVTLPQNFESGTHRNYAVRVLNDRLYIVTAYFAGALKMNIMADETQNIILTSGVGR
ncbi:MAG: copper amine oxidase N-terminal domain-containing protein [Clostridiales bacterium]|jgi:hypothetical protein|nr:copper amine oxidase N-terminal domain-containing protein [Clostridiales bacterium]